MHGKQIPAKADSPGMFDRIARRYDLLNHLLSCGMDILWRRRVANLLAGRPHRVLLDLACGTGDQLLSAIGRNPGIEHAIGVDMAEAMLRIGQAKLDRRGLNRRVMLSRSDGQRLPMADGCVDCATIAFGIRNMPDAGLCLREFLRVLKPGGSVAVLEFSMPPNALLRAVYLLYFRRILPWLGAVISGDSSAYRYLNKTVESFPCGEDFCRLVTAAGFETVRMIPLSGAIATIYLCTKRDGDNDDL